MRLYHGSPTLGLTKLVPGDAQKQGPGIYLTDNFDQAQYFARHGGQVYEVNLLTAPTLDFRDPASLQEVFASVWHLPGLQQEILALGTGVGVLHNILLQIPEEFKAEVNRELARYPIYCFPILGYRGYLNYVVKVPELVEIVS